MSKQRNTDDLSSHVLLTADHPLARRLAEFREMAAAAKRGAARAAEMRLGYEQLAASWDQLVKEIELAIACGKR